MYVFCIIIYKWIKLFDLKVMKHRKGIFRKGFSVVVWCQNLNFVFYVQRTSIFLKDGMVTNFSVNFEPEMSLSWQYVLFCLYHSDSINSSVRNSNYLSQLKSVIFSHS